MESVTISCPNCTFSKEVPPDKLPENESKITCPQCKSSFVYSAPRKNDNLEFIVEEELPSLTNNSSDMQKCPSCEGSIKIGAIKCKHCGAILNTPPDTPQNTSDTKLCPFCNESIHINAIKCKHCESTLNAVSAFELKSNPHTESPHMPPHGDGNYLSLGLSIMITFGILIGAIIINAVTHTMFIPFLLLIGCAIWAAIDSSNLEIRKYYSGFISAPWAVCVGMFMLWIVVFPWYLTHRSKIKSGFLKQK